MSEETITDARIMSVGFTTHPLPGHTVKLVERHPHLLHVTIHKDGGMTWRSTCPEEHLDYRCRRCSYGDLGCILEALLDDGVDPLEMLRLDEKLEDPVFPLRVDPVVMHFPSDDWDLAEAVDLYLK